MLDICCIKLDRANMMNIRSKHFDLPFIYESTGICVLLSNESVAIDSASSSR
jgi:hypothetical protein